MENSYTGPNYSEAEITQMVKEARPQVLTVVREEAKGDSSSFKKYGIVALLFSIVYTICLYKNHSGITYPIFMLITLGLLHILRKKDGLSLFKSRNGSKGLSIFYVVALLLLSIHKCLTTSIALLFLDATAILLLFFSFVLFLYADTSGWDVAGWLGGIIMSMIMPLGHLFRPIYDFSDWVKNRNGSMDSSKKQNLAAVAIGVACAIPVLIIVISLLQSADLVFSKLLTDLVKSIHLPDNIWDIVGIICTFVISFFVAYLIPLTLDKGDVKIRAKGQGKGNPVIAITFSSIIGFVYIVFCLIQVLYLFTGTVALPAGYTYAEYAHEGFYQLLAVCLINIAIVSICGREFKESKALTGVLVVIAGCTYIMIASSAKRMLLYIGVYHLTFLRLFVLWFLAVLSIWLLFLIVGMFAKGFPVFKASMVAITIAYVGFVYANPDYQIAKYDLVASDGKIDEYNSVETYIINNLSTDAAPALVGHEALLKKYELHITSRYRQKEDSYKGIRKYNISYARAQKLFKEQK